MSIHYACPVCKTAYMVNDQDAGKKSECTKCGQRIQVPGAQRNRTIIGEAVAAPAPMPPKVASPPPIPPAPAPIPPVTAAPPPLPKRDAVKTEPPSVYLPPLPPIPKSRSLPTAIIAGGVAVLLLFCLGGTGVIALLIKRGLRDRDTAPSTASDAAAGSAANNDAGWSDWRINPLTANTESTEKALTGEEVYRRLVHSSVLVVTPGGNGGTGFVVNGPKRLLVTNYHVVGKETRVAVVFPMYDRAGEPITDSRQYEPRIRELAVGAEVIDRDSSRDLALICVERLPEMVKPVVPSRKPASTGSVVFSVGGSGADDNLLWRLTRGNVRGRADRRQKADFGFVECKILKTDAPVNRGDSGGAVVNDHGELVGVVSHFAVGQRNISGNIDIDEVRTFLGRQGWSR